MAGKSKSKSKDKRKQQTQQAPRRELPALHKAAGKDNLVGLRELLLTNVDIDEQTVDKGATALMTAAYNGRYLAAALLLEAGADVTPVDNEGRTVLHHACYSGRKDIIALCLRYGADPATQDRTRREPVAILTLKDKKLVPWYNVATHNARATFTPSELKLLYAVDRGDESKVIEKLDKNREIEICNKDYIYALTWAVRQGKRDLVETLLLHCADVNQPDKLRNTPLHWAATKGFTDIARLLLGDPSVLLNVPNEGKMHTPLHLAATHNHPRVAQLLLDAGADPHVLAHNDNTPLHTACAHGASEVVRLLIAAGADVHQTDAFSVSPIHLAATAGVVESISYLVEANVDIDHTTSSGRTALATAARTGDAVMVRSLLELRARPNISNKRGDTPLHIAVMCLLQQKTAEDAHCFLDVISNLIEGGADLDIQNQKLKTPIQCIPVKSALRQKSPAQAAAITLARGGADLHVFLRPPIGQDEKDLVALLREKIAQTQPLPDGWERKRTKSPRQRVYFVNRELKKKQWADPRIEAVKEAPQTNINIDNITCSLCLELLYKPVTTMCGHSFCQICLSEAIAFNASCPLCRSDLKYSSDDHCVNTLLAEIIQGAYPEQYDARRLDVEAQEGAA